MQAPAAPTRLTGTSLLELLLWLGTVMVVVAGLFALLGTTDQSAAHREADRARALLQALIQSSELPNGHYTGAQEKLLADHLAPPELVEDGQLRSRWGPIQITPVDIEGRHNAGVSVTYEQVPGDDCFAFVQRLPGRLWALHIGATQVGGLAGLDRPLAMQACSTGPVSVALTHYNKARGDLEP